jgi:hypothetical protein
MDSPCAAGALALRCLLLTGVALWAGTSAAFAATNTVTYTVAAALSAPPSPGSPANLGYHWTQHVDTTPPGQQPDLTPSHTIFFATPIKSNGRYFPSCSQAAVDGMYAMPASCQNAIVGTGTATVYAGTPGAPRGNSVREDLRVSLLNGPAGASVLMVLSSSPGAPVVITNRVVPGTMVSAAEPYSFGIRFEIPGDLQMQLGLTLTFTDIDVTISGAARQITSGPLTRSASYLQATDCAGVLPIQDAVDFKGASGAQTTVTADGTVPCDIGALPVDPGIPTGPITTDVPFADAPQVHTPTGLLTAVATRNGAFDLPRVRVACPVAAAGPCEVSGVALAIGGAARALKPPALARVHLTVAPGATTAVRMQLTRAGKTAVRRQRLTRMSVGLLVTAPGGLELTKLLRVAVQPPKGTRGKH